MIYKILRRILAVLAALALTAAFFYCAFSYLIYPSLFLDEAYYAGAIVKTLNGDFFLRTFSFDKPFLHPWLAAIGALILGENPIGFKFAGMIFLLASMLVFFEISYRVLSLKLERYWGIVIGAAASMAFFLDPLMLVFNVGVFAEAFMIFFLLMWVRCFVVRVPGQGEEKIPARESLWFFAAVAIKLTAAFWGAALLFAWWPFDMALLWRRAKKWLLWGVPVMVTILFFMLTNQQKLAPLKMATAHSYGHDQTTTFSERVGFWFSQLWMQGRWPLVLTFAATVFVLILWAVPRSRNWARTHLTGQRLFWILNVAAALHLLGLIFSGAPLMNRYLCILIPQMGLALMFFVTSYGGIRQKTIRVGLLLTVTVVLGALGFRRLSEPFQPLVPNLAWGRALILLPDLAYNGFFHTNFSWEMYPFSASREFANYSSCQSEKCLLERRKGRPVDSTQYVFSQREGGVDLWQAPLVAGLPTNSKCRSVKIEKTEAVPWKVFEGNLNDFTRIANGTAWTLVREEKVVSTAVAPSTELSKQGSPWVNLGDGQFVELETTLNGDVTLQMRAQWVATGDSRLLLKEGMLGSAYAGLLVQSLRWKQKGWDLTDLVPLLWHSSFLPVQNLAFVPSLTNRILDVNYDGQAGVLKFTEERVPDLAACQP